MRRATTAQRSCGKSPQVFLSTPSVRRATHLHRSHLSHRAISIHALREEGDLSLADEIAAAYEFLSTPSARRATDRCGTRRYSSGISIHALREEGDAAVSVGFLIEKDISIHALREEGDAALPSPRIMSSRFLSTPSARRATHVTTFFHGGRVISIHALREEGDSTSHFNALAAFSFLSTPSARRATRRYARRAR